MKLTIVTLLLPIFSFAQAPAPPSAPPTSRPPAIQGAPPPVAPDAVVANIGGKDYTAAEIDKLIAGLPPQIQPQIRSNPRSLTQVFLYRELERMALAEKLDQQSPNKEQLELVRTQTLAQLEMNSYRYSQIKITEEDEQAFYKAHSTDRFGQAKVSVIYLQFRPANPQTDDQKKLPTEAEAKAKADDLRKQLQNGADFAKLAKENSNDKASAEKGGDYGVITQASAADALKKVTFALKPGEISEPVRQPNGFYVVRVDSFSTQPFDVVQGAIDEEIRTEKFGAFMSGLQTKFAVKVENPNYFAPRPMPTPVRPPVPGNSK
jgi:peptidyl-prolyl cis-trans isomerase C